MTSLDPVTFEILRHRLVTIVNEGAISLRNVSGSPTVALSNDCNVALLNERGEAVVVGPTIVTHALACSYACNYVDEHCAANPGINPGDMFFTNDPYVATPHQTCTVVVAPMFAGGTRIGWTGAGIHVADAGGSTPGQVSLGAQSVWDEGLPMPPVRMVEGGVLRSDIEADWLRRSRTAAQNAIDLRAKIAANTVMQQRVMELADRYGPDTVAATMERILDSVEARLRGILREIPDGSWSEETYLDYFDRGRVEIYACRLTLTKQGDSLVFDFSGSSRQAPGVINVTRPALEGYVVRAVMATFGYAVPLCPAGVARVCDVRAERGSFVDCDWPAGVCKGTTSGTYAVFHAVTGCISRMLADGGMPDRAITTWRSHMPLFDFAAFDAQGNRFAGVFTDCGLGQGSGARGAQDGIDTGSGSEPEVTVPNVETNELRYPWLYLFRRQGRDSAGAGLRRGGVGIEVGLTPHGVDEIGSLVFHSHGLDCPSSPPFDGGYPGSANVLRVFRQARDTGSMDSDANPAVDAETPPSFGRTSLRDGDVLFCSGAGGSGWGDPLERAAEAVAADVASGLLSIEAARQLYGVALGSGGSVDEALTDDLRAGVRRQRLEAAAADPEAARAIGALPQTCPRCSESLASGVKVIEVAWADLGEPYAPFIDTGFRLLAGVCRTCGAFVASRNYLPPDLAVPAPG